MIDLFISDGIATVRINNPEKLNALSPALMNELYDNLYGIEKKACVLVITGIDKAFAVGVDISEIAKYDYEQAHLNNLIDSHWEIIQNLKIPVIASVSGYALGGGFELALMSDIVIASEKATFGFPEVNLGLMPGLGGSQMLTKIVGGKKAAEMLMTGDFISAQQAYDLNIISQIVPQEKLSIATNDLAEKLASKPKMSLMLIKEAVRLSQDCGLSQGIRMERMMFRSLFSTQDKAKKVSEFLSKRK